jgi:hypothetical protein
MTVTSPGSTADWLLSTFKRNPEGLLLLGAGAVLLMRQGRGNGSGQGREPRSTSRTAFSSAADKAGEARDAAAELTDRTTRNVSEMASTAADYAKQATRQVAEQSGRVAQQTQVAVQKTFGRVVEEQPLAIALAGVAVGAAIAWMFPTSDFEKQTVAPIGNQASQAALEKIKGAAATAGETLKSAVEDRGLDAEGLREVASDVVDAVSSGVGARGNGQGRPMGDGSRPPEE